MSYSHFFRCFNSEAFVGEIAVDWRRIIEANFRVITRKSKQTRSKVLFFFFFLKSQIQTL
ncbi:hypothetical protein RchiOBHm_Chr7g0211561 [Rosa chinensis]|uniref:Uncharacterized protein n=1 Tax=Rosa chinensis TaxID=74649 RepID=A0A2P6PAG8_ROSCH|nr:hypothetical protein RchiOBHm_Chr7g0211561 [Rosa chinensis]